MNASKPSAVWSVSTVSGPGARRSLLSLLGVAGACGLALLAGCAAPGAGSVRRLETGDDGLPDPDPQGSLSEAQAREVAFVALGLVDTPYRYGGNTPQGGFDCSGLIVYAFQRAAGVRLPRTVAGIARAGQRVRADAVRSGDLVLFDTAGPFTHAGIYVGDDRFVHAPSAGGQVRLDGVLARYWRPRFSGVRRV